jgi:hypothetical protein
VPGIRDPFSRWLTEYSASEENVVDISRASIDVVMGPDPSPIEVVQHFYRDKLSRMRADTHAYAETGSLQTSVLLHRGTVKELFPVSTPQAVEELMGIRLDMLKWLVDERLVLLIIQRPELYRELAFLHPLLKSRFAPACYETRDRAIYDWLAGGDYDRYLRRAQRHAFLFERPFPPSLQEPYELLVTDPPERSRQRNHQRYAALGAVMGCEALDEVIALPTRTELTEAAVTAAQRRFFFVHRYLLHPTTQGLGGLPYVAAESGDHRLDIEWAGLGGELERELGDVLRVRLPRTVTPEVVEKAHASKLPDEYEALERRLLMDAVWDERSVGLTARERAANIVDGLETMAQQFDANFVGQSTAVLRIASIGGAVRLAKSAPEASAALAAAAALPTSAAAAIVDGVHRVFRRRYLPWQYWRLLRTTRSLARRGEAS